MGRLLAAEAVTLGLATAAVEDATRRLVDAVVARGASTSEDAARNARQAIRDVTGTLDGAFASAIQTGREKSREQSRGQVALEVALILAACQGQGIAGPKIGADVAVDTSSDQAWSKVSAASMAAAWGAAAIAALGRWHSGGGQRAALPKALQGTTAAVAERVERHAVTQSATAYAEQHRALWQSILDADLTAEPLTETELGLPHGWKDVVYDVWSAYLDRRTCPTCWALDGQMVPIGKPFMARGAIRLVPGKGIREAALHPHCRCFVITTVIPEAIRSRLPGVQLDFAALKEDVREFFDGLDPRAALQGRRHAMDFIQESLGGQRSFSGKVGTSPEALTRRLQERRYVAGGQGRMSRHRGPGWPTPRGEAPRGERAGRQIRLEGTHIPSEEAERARGVTAADVRQARAEAETRVRSAEHQAAQEQRARVAAEARAKAAEEKLHAANTETAKRIALEDEIAAAPVLQHGELDFLRTGMRPESLEHAAHQLTGKIDVTAAALAREPIIVDVYADGKRALGDGRHRLAAAQAAGARAIRVKVRTYGPRGGLKSEVIQIMRIDHTTPVVPVR